MEILIPADSKLHMPSAADLPLFESDMHIELLESFKLFLVHFENYLGKSIHMNDFNSGIILHFINTRGNDVSIFLRNLLDFYYSDSKVLKSIPTFSGVVFPNSRIMPTTNLLLLESVVYKPRKQESE